MSLATSILLAELHRGDSLSESFRSHSGRDDVLLGLLMAAALVAALWAASRLLGLRRRRHDYNSPRQLFRALCKAHHLTWSDRALLARVARHYRLQDPGRLFLEPQRWDEQALNPTFAMDLGRLRTLRKQLFEGAAQGGAVQTAPRAAAGVRNASLGRKLGTMLSDGPRHTSAVARSTGSGRKAHEQPPATADHELEHASIMPGTAPAECPGGVIKVPSPLLPVLPTPTLDVPPWTEVQSVEG
jgi:hypothetical protein